MRCKYLPGLFLLCVLWAGNLFSQPLVKGYKQTDISDMILIYQGGAHRMDWTADQFLPYVVHQNADGNKNWLFDGFLFLEFKDGKGRCYASRYEKLPARKQEWIWLMDRVFEKGKSLYALNECIQSQIEEIGAPSFRHKVVIGLPEPIPDQKDWGTLDGQSLDFSNDADKLKACRWYIDELTKRFKEAGFANLDLAGFYWVSEDIVTSKALTVPIGDYIRSKDFLFYWIPYWNAMGYSDWKELGFDVAYAQPNHFFEASIPDQRIDETCRLARTHNLGLEVEFDERVFAGQKDSFYDRLVAYLDRFEKNGVYDDAAIAYYEGGGAILGFSKSSNLKDRALIDRLASLVCKRRQIHEASDLIIGLDDSIWKVTQQTPYIVSTKGLLEKQYGYIELKAKLLSDNPDVKVSVRLKPVKRLYGSGAQSGEITLLEYDGKYPDCIKGGIFSKELNWETGNKKGATLPVFNLSGDYHSFICEWTAGNIKLYVNDVLFFSMDDDFNGDTEYWPFNQPFYLEIEIHSQVKESVLKLNKVSFD